MTSTMKRSLFCCAVLSLLCSASYAQSRVTLYGVLDEGIDFQSNVNSPTGGGKRFFLDSLSGVYGSRWGLTGAEDLGGGLQAIFTLESGINLNNGNFGQGGTAFGRQVFVGLNSDRLGSLTLGRQYDMVFYFPEPLTGASLLGSAVGTQPGDIDNASNSIRVNNAVRYMSPDFRGVTFGGEYSVGGVAGNATANSGYSLGAGYTNGPFKFGAAFEYFKNPTSATPGSGFFTAYANGASTLSGSLNSGYTSAQAYQTAIAAANYTVGATTFAASFSNNQYANLGGALSGGTARFNNFDIGAKYLFTPFLSTAIFYDYLIGKGVTTGSGETVGNQHYHQVSALTDYSLSKRTDVYLGLAWQRASGTSSKGTPAVANIGNLSDSSNNHQFLVRVAIRQRF